jgi:hypothetical protein
MPKHVYDSLSLEPLNKTSIVIQLADHNFVYPLGVIKDVLVKIDSMVIPCDFYILDMEHNSCDSSNITPILFGRPFLKTANTKIDCGKDTLPMEVGDKVLLYHLRLKLFLGKLHFRWIGPFVVSNIFHYGAVEITSLETNKVLKVNEYCLKPFYEGWTTELTASVGLAEPIYKE